MDENNISESLYHHKEILESIFRAIDKDHSGNGFIWQSKIQLPHTITYFFVSNTKGKISKEEFGDCCKLLNQHSPAEMFSIKNIKDMADTM